MYVPRKLKVRAADGVKGARYVRAGASLFVRWWVGAWLDRRIIRCGACAASQPGGGDSDVDAQQRCVLGATAFPGVPHPRAWIVSIHRHEGQGQWPCARRARRRRGRVERGSGWAYVREDR